MAPRTVPDFPTLVQPTRGFVTAIVLMLPALSLNPVFSRAATLQPEEIVSNEGYYQLTWEADEPIRLVESTRPDFASKSVVYSGSDTGHVASGKPDGTWYYRLESEDGSSVLSETSTITVRHHSLRRAFSFFALGGLVFAATLGLILFARPDGDERS